MNIDIVKEFQEIEERINIDSAQNKDITGLLRKKARLLKVCYNQISDAMKTGVLQEVAPNFAKTISFLNNIKELQTQTSEDTTETDAEIKKVENRMRELGLGWILDNLPQQQEG